MGGYEPYALLSTADSARPLGRDGMNARPYFFTAAMLMLTMVFTACNKDEYVAGWEKKGEGKSIATVWKNGIAKRLSDGTYAAEAKSVFISGKDVFVVGKEANSEGKDVATLWKNGKPHRLSNGEKDAVAQSIYVSGNVVYVVGYEGRSDESVACLWKNGVLQSLSDYKDGTKANSVFVYGQDVYVAGVATDYGDILKMNYSIAALWKNGIYQRIPGGDLHSEAHSVFVSNNNVYVTFTEYDVRKYNQSDPIYTAATLWNDGNTQRLSDSDNEAEANSVFVIGSDVYVAGKEGRRLSLLETKNMLEKDIGFDLRQAEKISVATMWKNGESQRLGDMSKKSRATSVYVSGKDVYVSGEEEVKENVRVAMLWKNGVAHRLTDGEHPSAANSVFVK